MAVRTPGSVSPEPCSVSVRGVGVPGCPVPAPLPLSGEAVGTGMYGCIVLTPKPVSLQKSAC